MLILNQFQTEYGVYKQTFYYIFIKHYRLCGDKSKIGCFNFIATRT